MKKSFILFSALFFLISCGGGGGSTSSSSGGGTTQAATITGQVAGTIVIAVDQNGNEVDRDTASGTPKIFTITVPIGGKYRLYLIENDGLLNMGIYPVYYGSSNVLAINTIATINLGFVTVETSRNIATTASDPFTQGASDGGVQSSMPSVLFLPGTWGVSRIAPAPAGPWCERGNAIITSSGALFPFSGSMERYGTATIVNLSANLTIGSTGFINASSFEDPSWMGVIDSGRTVVVGMETRAINTPPGDSRPEMEIWVKKPTSYSIADLAGTWEYNALDPSYGLWSDGTMKIGWWGRGNITIDSNGSFSGIINGSDGSATPTSKTLSITSDGIFTDNLDPSMKCFLDAGKTVMACTNTGTDLVHGQLDFSILLKKAASYSLSDLTGTWQYSELDSEIDWQRGPLTFDANGSFLLQPASTFAGQFISKILPAPSGNFTMIPGGYDISSSSGKCVMDSGKTVMVCTGNASYNAALAIIVKVEPY